MRVLICGSRTWNDVEVVANLMQRMSGDVTIIHGDAVGADTIAEVVAGTLGFKILRYPVTDEDWRMQGKAAGFNRNKKMLFEGRPDLCVAFIDTLVDSPGTHNMVELCESYGCKVFKVFKACWPEKCPTCDGVYVKDQMTVCSNAFHCCRDCTWKDGVVTVPCAGHRREDPNTV